VRCAVRVGSVSAAITRGAFAARRFDRHAHMKAVDRSGIRVAVHAS
jgi:hypothetical protein